MSKKIKLVAKNPDVTLGRTSSKPIASLKPKIKAKKKK